FAPRKPRSGWAATNKARVERLIRDGRMRPAGLAAIERAKSNGSWEVLDGPERLEVPPDLAAALDARPAAAANFAGFSPSARKMALAWIATAQKPETRARRIDQVADAAARNERIRG
ncbi:MAG TPA: YdeI/OmpD-associated family protein, partial [Clostridia bacterium]|nr:YdeI/OmpD-associated family protein [Clostridia bacterium]